MTKKELCELIGKYRFYADMIETRVGKAISLIELVKNNMDDTDEEILSDALSITINYLLEIMEDLATQQEECKKQIGELSEQIVKEQLDAKQ